MLSDLSAIGPSLYLCFQRGPYGLIKAHRVALGSEPFERFTAQSLAGFVFGLGPYQVGVTSWTAPNLVPDAARRAEQARCAPVLGESAGDPSQVHHPEGGDHDVV